MVCAKLLVVCPLCFQSQLNNDTLFMLKRLSKVSFFGLCSKMQIIPIKKFNIKTCFIQFLCSFRLKCWFKGQIISRIHLSLPNAYKLMCFDRKINGNRDVKFLIGIIGHCTDGRKLLYLPICSIHFVLVYTKRSVYKNSIEHEYILEGHCILVFPS